MLITKRGTSPTHCTPISPSIRVCWADLVVISLILLIVAYFLFGVPLTARLYKILRRTRNSSSRSSRGTVSSPHRLRISPRRQDSQATLVDESANVGDDMLDGNVHHRFIGMSRDPFLVVQPSLNDSMLVKQGLVEETTLPQPTHSARDIQAPPCQVVWSDNAFESSSQGPRSSTNATPLVPKTQGGTATFCSKGSTITRDTKTEKSCETDGSRETVPPPPPAYTPFSVGQGRRTSSYDEVIGVS